MGISSYIIRINYIASIAANGDEAYFLYNGHGDVVQTVDEAGTIQNQYDYDIWGNPTLTVETTSNAIRYAGEFLDNETGIYYLRARYYDPYTGRFTTEDSYWGEDENPLSLNLYTYCFNNPVMYTDPTGHAVAKLGTRGDTVQAIQEKLNKLGYNVGKADGIFGEKTKAAVIKFQKDNGLTVDGIVGNQTLTEIYFEQSKQSAKANGINLPEAQKAKVGQISGNVSIMTDAKFNQAIANIVETKAKTNGGSLNTDVKNNEIVVTKVNIGTKTPTSAPATVTPKTAVPAASSSQMSSLTNTVAKISSAIAESNAAAVTASKSTSSISNGNTKNILNTIVNTAIEFAAGAAVAAVAADNNMMFGAAQGISGENIQSDSVAFNTGKLTVDAGTAIKGISTLVGGLGGEIIGVGLDGTIIFAPAGVAVAVASAGAVAYGGAVTYRSMNNLVNDSRDLINSATQGGSNASRMTTKEAKAAAKELGYEPTNYVTKSGEKVFYNKKTKTYISQDVGSGNGMGSHNGGVWKAAKSPEALNSKDTRLGTYDANMNRIGD